MHMAFNDPGDNRFTLRIHHPRMLGFETRDVCIAANGDNLVARNGQTLSKWLGGVHRNYARVINNQISL